MEYSRVNRIICLLKPLLYLCSLIYYAVVIIRKTAYRWGIFKSVRLDLRVVSVGNITTGGTGKTPLVIMLADFFKKSGKKVAVSTRGYGGEFVNSQTVLNPDTILDDEKGYLGDEIYIFKSHLKDIPILVGKERVKIIKKALEEEKPHVLILDDGFQHLRLKRDLDIVTVNALNPFGNYNLIPYGILREPLSSLRRTDIFVITKADLADDIAYIKDSLKKVNPKAVIVCSQHLFKGLYELERQEGIDKSSLKDKKIGTICAIGDPDSFERLLRKEGFAIKIGIRFIDHHIFGAGEIEKFINRCLSEGIDTVVTTEKDIFRLKDFLYIFKGVNIKLVFARIELKLTENKEAFFERLSALSVS